MGNLGKATVWAKIGGEMPNMDFTTEERIQDLPASDAYKSFMNRADGDPSYIEFIEDPTAGGFMVIPQRRYTQVANYMSGVSSSTDFASPRIMWNVLEKSGDDQDLSGCVGNETYLTDFITNKSQAIMAPGSYDESYSGPRWDNPRMPKAFSSDETETEKTETTDTQTADDFSTSAIGQLQSCQDVWWAIQTTSLSSEVMSCVPFFIDVVFQKPLVNKQSTFLMLRFGNITNASAEQNSDIITLVFIDGQSATMYDQGMITEETDADGKTTLVPAHISLNGNIAWDGQMHRIGILPLAGRLCISVDGVDTLYSRIDQEAANTEEKDKVDQTDSDNPAITKGTVLFFPSYSQIRLIGSNSKVVISLSATTFPQKATLHTSMTGGFDEATGAGTSPLEGSTSGLADGNNDSCSMVELPNNEEKPILGAFAKSCDGRALDGGDTWGISSKEHMFGLLSTKLVEDKISGQPANIPKGKHYAIFFETEKRSFGEGGTDKGFRTGFPIWFRLRGVGKVKNNAPTASDFIDVSEDIMELNESFTSPDRYHVTHSVDLVLYNENGKYDDITERSSPIQVGYSWGSLESEEGGGTIEDTVIGGEESGPVVTTCFTGVTLNGSRTLVAGKETMSIHCEDYMFILGATQIINSPYFDGMDGYNVVKTLATKSHVMCTDDTGSKAGQRYFLPSGYSFLEPVKRYDGKMMVKDAILDVCSMAPKVVYFDGDGLLHYSDMQGGIAFNSAASAIPSVSYSSDPATASDKTLILDQKQLEIKLNSVVNNIYCRTVDRTNRTIVMMNDKAETDEDILCYKKVMYMMIPSLGSFQAMTNYVERIKVIAYKPIRSVTIKTADDSAIIPMDYMEVDGKKYRIMGMTRNINIADNSISTSLTGEWMGAQ